MATPPTSKATDPSPKNWTEVKDKLAPHTTKPAIKNSPNSFVFGAKRERSSKNPITKIPIDPKIMDPIIGFCPPRNSRNWGTIRPAIEITNKKDNKIKIFKNGKWEYCKKTEILDDIMNNNYYLLDSHYDDIGKELLNDVQNLQYSAFKHDFQTGELDKDTKEDIDLLLLNAD